MAHTEPVIAYYPGNTPLFEGDVVIREIPTDPADPPAFEATVEGSPSLDLMVVSTKEIPLRTVHTGYFKKAIGSLVRVCHVDLELDEQPDKETIARAILAEAPETI